MEADMRKLTILILVAALAVGGPIVLAGGSSNAAGDDSAMAPGGRFIAALAGHDFNGAQALLADDIDFKGYTPSKAFFELKGARDVMALMHEWYDPPSAIEMLETDRVVDRHRVSYRIRWRDPAGASFVFEQHAFYDLVDGRISQLQLVCSGDRPLS
jgi:SnoaL-like protein